MNPTKYYSNKQEKMIANYLDWEVVSGSGARDFHPGDIKSDRWIGECKTHTSSVKKITFRKDVWIKIQNEAHSQFKLPVLFVDDGSQDIRRTWCMFPSSVAANYEPASLPIKFKVNISFDCDKLLDYKDPFILYDYLETEFEVSKVGIVPLVKFKDMFG